MPLTQGTKFPNKTKCIDYFGYLGPCHRWFLKEWFRVERTYKVTQFNFLLKVQSMLNSVPVAQGFIHSGLENLHRGLQVASYDLLTINLTVEFFQHYIHPFQFMTTVSYFPTVHLSKENGSVFLVSILVYTWWLLLGPSYPSLFQGKQGHKRLSTCPHRSHTPAPWPSRWTCPKLFLLEVGRTRAKLDTVLQIQSGNIWNKCQLKGNKAVCFHHYQGELLTCIQPTVYQNQVILSRTTIQPAYSTAEKLTILEAGLMCPCWTL